MTSSNGNIFRVTGPCLTKPSRRTSHFFASRRGLRDVAAKSVLLTSSQQCSRGKLPRGSYSVISSTWTRHRRKSLCLWESFWRRNSIYLRVRKSHVYGCDTPLRRPGSWRNNFLRRRTWRLRHDTLIRRRVSQRLVFATSRLRQALVRQGPGPCLTKPSRRTSQFFASRRGLRDVAAKSVLLTSSQQCSRDATTVAP